MCDDRVSYEQLAGKFLPPISYMIFISWTLLLARACWLSLASSPTTALVRGAAGPPGPTGNSTSKPSMIDTASQILLTLINTNQITLCEYCIKSQVLNLLVAGLYTQRALGNFFP